MMKVICLPKVGMPLCLVAGEFYFIDRESIYITDSGMVYGVVYDKAQNYCGKIALNCFASV